MKTGVYYGYAQVVPPQEHKDDFQSEDLKVLPMVMSLGWNPFYKNERLTAVSEYCFLHGSIVITKENCVGDPHYACLPVRFLWS